MFKATPLFAPDRGLHSERAGEDASENKGRLT